MTLLVLAVVMSAGLFIALSLPGVQRDIRTTCERELSKLLDSSVTIEDLNITPFNRVTLRHVAITDALGDTALTVERLGAGLSLLDLAVHRNVVVNYAEIIGLDGRLHRAAPGAPLNISNIIEALRPKEKKSTPAMFDLRINSIVLRRTSFTYDIDSVSPAESARWDRNHISISNMRADIEIPRLSNDAYLIDLKRLAFDTRAGLTVTDFSGRFDVTSHGISVADMQVSLPASRLNFGTMQLDYDGWDRLPDALHSSDTDMRISISRSSYVTPSDLACFYPSLARLTSPIRVWLTLRGSLDHATLSPLEISGQPAYDFALRIVGEARHLDRPDSLTVDLPTIALKGDADNLATILSDLFPLSNSATSIIGRTGDFTANGSLAGTLADAHFTGRLTTDVGHLDIDADYLRDEAKEGARIKGRISTGDAADAGEDGSRGEGINLATLLDRSDCGLLTADITTDALISHGGVSGTVDATVHSLDFKGYNYTDISLRADIDRSRDVTLSAQVDDEALTLSISGEAHLAGKESAVRLTASLDETDLNALGLMRGFPAHRLAFNLEADITGNSPDNADGTVAVSDLSFTDETDPTRRFDLSRFVLTASPSDSIPSITVESDVLDMTLRGPYCISTLPATLRDMASRALPALFPDGRPATARLRVAALHPQCHNRFNLHATLRETEDFADFFHLPVSVLYPVEITGRVDDTSSLVALSVDAPYLRQNKKIIERTRINAALDGRSDSLSVRASASMPTKDGLMDITVNADGSDNRVLAFGKWHINRERRYNGDVSLSARFLREDDQLSTTISIFPGTVEFNDAEWEIHPAGIYVNGSRDITVKGFDVSRGNQYVKINGRASLDPDDSLTLDLSGFSLDDLFETLQINKVNIGGAATGTFHASELFTPAPSLTTPGLHVKGLSYNKAVLGDALISSHYDVDTKGIMLRADIAQPDSLHSIIDGGIYPAADSLDLHFSARNLNVAFLGTFMSGFASDVHGKASGEARLWGKFKTIDLEADLLARDFGFRVNITNVDYTVTDSIHARRGYIPLNGITVRDRDGHTALLNGALRHSSFKNLHYNIELTEARRLLMLDINDVINPVWYGRIFGNGRLSLNGGDGVIDIDANVTTTDGSTFTFVASDMEVADEYTFVTMREKNYVAISDSLDLVDPTPRLVRHLREKNQNEEDDESSIYNMKLTVTATPATQMIMVMDPVGNDRIRTRGSGTITIGYSSLDDLLHMYGRYVIEHGSYNFTLQDIIIKDFTIKEGSAITFNDDPNQAQLDISAVYALTANLSDLDESFSQDRDLNRTNVPVHAVLNVTGYLQQPEIGFNLEFPTLNQDIDRKVRSIVSTDDMMNRQIIYLLALNRFYTPDYMASTRRGNELVSVASSTISSQLSSMLGELSENWSISPNFRSDRGDFSDMEVDLALSSNLLNNRLLLNGNFGYRDKTLNNNQFVGDFDVQYLLNRSGSVRLKAYNRYNDQNYYIKTATTTQGVGVAFRRDFDDMWQAIRSIFRRKPGSAGQSVIPASVKTPAVPDSLLRREPVTVPPDTVILPDFPADSLFIFR